MTSVASQLRILLDAGALDLPPVGTGATPRRWRSLADLARQNVSLGRLAEAHVDAVQILREAGRSVGPGRLLGVWASEHPRWMVSAEPTTNGIVLHGAKAFCSGAGIVDDALVTVATEAGPLLVLVSVGNLEAGRVDLSAWRATALADTATATVDLDGVEVPRGQIIEGAAWYLDRPGFWHGAVGPAACWGGGALGLVDHAALHAPTDPHGRAHLGALLADAWAIDAILERAGRDVDDLDGQEGIDASRCRALIVRHLIDDRCESIQRHFERAMGPRPLAADPKIIERHGALTLYRRQCHAERDLEALAEAAASPDAPT